MESYQESIIITLWMHHGSFWMLFHCLVFYLKLLQSLYFFYKFNSTKCFLLYLFTLCIYFFVTLKRATTLIYPVVTIIIQRVNMSENIGLGRNNLISYKGIILYFFKKLFFMSAFYVF